MKRIMKQKTACRPGFPTFAACLFLACLPLASTAAPNAPSVPVSLISDSSPGPAAMHGLSRLEEAFRKKGIAPEKITDASRAGGRFRIYAGLATGPGPAATELAAGRGAQPEGPESFVLRPLSRQGRRRDLLAAASDDRGLMYALLELADRVRAGADPLSALQSVPDTTAKPAAPDRAVSIYTFQRAYWESRFYDREYWEKYLDMLAQNRFNSLILIFGYENGGFLAPCYPYFFDVEGFPEVRMVGITAAEQQRNLQTLNGLIRMAHERGIRLTLGIWDHIYRGGVQGGGIPGADEATRKPTPGLVWGVTGDNLVAYTKAALAQLVRRVPDLDGIQFRMHDESGLKNSEQEAFWRDVFRSMKEKAPGLRLDLRAKGLPDSVIQSAVEEGIRFRITTKYWMEQMGLPFHPTHINRQNQFDRRHSYADLLRYPQQYKMHWRLWNGGTARVLLWGDPDYVRRFVDSTRLYGGDGFEVNEPLCSKMEAQPHDAPPFELLNPSRRYYRYEFERYWHFFQLFGRLGYQPDASPELWHGEFVRRFGPQAAPAVEKGLHLASRVLPRIVASCYPYSAFPLTRGWAEKQRLGDLPAYARAEGSDIQQFVAFDQEAQLLLSGGEDARIRPPQNSRWFQRTYEAISAAIADAEKAIGRRRNPEFDSTMTDLRILAQLALYHSHRIPAAVSYCLFQRTGDRQALEEALRQEGEAIDAWRKLVAAAGDFYASDLQMGVRGAALCGHWKDELGALEKGHSRLTEELRTFQPKGDVRQAPRYRPVPERGDTEPPRVTIRPLMRAEASRPLTVSVEAGDTSGVKWLRLLYRSVNQHLDYKVLPMQPGKSKGSFQATIPAEELNPGWDLMFLVEAMDNRGNGKIYPDLEKETPYVIVPLHGHPPR